MFNSLIINSSRWLCVLSVIIFVSCKSAGFSGDEEKTSNSSETKPSNDDEGVPGYFLDASAVTVKTNSAGSLEITGKENAVIGDLTEAALLIWTLEQDFSNLINAEPPVKIQATRLAVVEVGKNGQFSATVKKVEYLVITTIKNQTQLILPVQSNHSIHTIVMGQGSFRAPAIGGKNQRGSVDFYGSCLQSVIFTCINFYGDWPGRKETCQTPHLWSDDACEYSQSIGHCRLNMFDATSEEIYYPGHAVPGGDLAKFCAGMGGVYSK